MKNLFEMNSVQRTVVLWIAFMATMWIVFGIGLVTHPDAYTYLPAVGRETGWRVAAFILGSNGCCCCSLSLATFSSASAT